MWELRDRLVDCFLCGLPEGQLPTCARCGQRKTGPGEVHEQFNFVEARDVGHLVLWGTRTHALTHSVSQPGYLYASSSRQARRQADRQTDRQTGVQSDRQTDRHTDKQTDR
jgi:hypothetical protein